MSLEKKMRTVNKDYNSLGHAPGVWCRERREYWKNRDQVVRSRRSRWHDPREAVEESSQSREQVIVSNEVQRLHESKEN